MSTTTDTKDADSILKFKSVKTQNDTLFNSIQNMSELYSTDNNRKLYKTANFEKVKNFTIILFFIYYALLFIFTLFITFKQKIKWYYKIFLISIFAAYPFLIYFIENLIYQFIAFIMYNV